MESIGYVLLSIVALCWIGAMFYGVVKAFPFGIIVLIGIVGLAFLFGKVVKDRLENKEDDHYSENVDK